MSYRAISEVSHEKWLHGVFQDLECCSLRYKLFCKGTYFGSNKITTQQITHTVDLLSSNHQPRGEHLIPSPEHLVSEMSSSYRHVFGHIKCAKSPFHLHSLHFVARTRSSSLQTVTICRRSRCVRQMTEFLIQAESNGEPLLFRKSVTEGGRKYLASWFQTFAVFCMLYVFFWVIPRRLNFICRRFGTLCLFHLHRQVGK